MRPPARWRTALAASVISACGPPDIPERGVPASFERAEGGPLALSILETSAVTGRTGPGGRVFSVELRTPELDHYPCASCHVEPVTPGARGTEEHADVQPVHPRELGATCATCHAASDPARLALQNGDQASLDEAYRLCAQCHYAQADAWTGGAHGKRLAGWRGDRVVMSCTGCHDPHDPPFDTRIPFRAPNIPTTGRLER